MKNRNDGISWTHDTFNPWEGCDKVSAPCAHCYIDRILRQHGRQPWGKLYRTGKGVWNKPYRWQNEIGNGTLVIGRNEDGSLKRHCNNCGSTTDTPRHLAKCGTKPETYIRMFTCSLSDFFHAKADEWRPVAWEIIRNTPNVIYLILTKRPARILTHLPKDWGDSGYSNVWLGTSIGDNKSVHYADVLRKVPAAVRFLSCEPLIEDITDNLDITGINWIIAGGESGSGEECRYDPKSDWRKAPATGRRTMDLAWAYKLYMKANEAGIPFFFKQVTSARSGQGPDRLTGQVIHEFPAPPNGGVWWTPPTELVQIEETT